MDVREKLVELLKRTDREVYEALKDREDYREEMLWDYFASNLIANGVTFANDNNVGDKLTPTADKLSATEWISVEKQMPPYNTDVLVYRPNMAMKIIVDSYDGYYGEDDEEWYEGWRKYGKDIHNNPIITHWAKLPQPPKGE